MPAADKYHSTVKRALVKAGWTIVGEQVPFKIDSRYFFVDLRAVRNNDEVAILVEVKDFESSPAKGTLLMEAIGQYRVYLSVFALSRDDTPLYLAVPVEAYNGILTETVGRQVLHDNQVNLLVFDPKTEEIVKWIPQP
jgi:hypothetical protein